MHVKPFYILALLLSNPKKIHRDRCKYGEFILLCANAKEDWHIIRDLYARRVARKLVLPGGRRVCVSVCVLSQIYPSSPFKLVQYEQEGRKQGRKQVFYLGGGGFYYGKWFKYTDFWTNKCKENMNKHFSFSSMKCLPMQPPPALY